MRLNIQMNTYLNQFATMDNKSNIGFKLVVITTDQFAIIEDNYTKEADIKVEVGFRFAADIKQKLVAVFNKFTYSSNDKKYLLIEAGCHFAISEDSWEGMFDEKLNKLIVPKVFLRQMTMLTVGTTRGILHAKTENTPFNQYLIPLINVEEFIKEDTELKIDEKSVVQ